MPLLLLSVLNVVSHGPLVVATEVDVEDEEEEEENSKAQYRKLVSVLTVAKPGTARNCFVLMIMFGTLTQEKECVGDKDELVRMLWNG